MMKVENAENTGSKVSNAERGEPMDRDGECFIIADG
jgi:hypothetical protein